jgi:cellulose synthase (UDP-forming)
VDVFLPNCGEDLTVLTNTMAYVSRMQWSGELTVYVLDDAGRPEVADLARRYGFEYIARPGSQFKKAGNLQYAYERSSGDHILILDADFVPRWDMLHELIPYMDEPGTGIVQSPQYFRTDTSLGWLERSAGATQELFFRHIQPSRDAVGAAICVGTSAVYRREALDAIGGFPLIGHSEDVFTGVFMAREGYSLQYVPVLLSRGECPSDMDSFIAQQYRWCEGSMALVGSDRFHEDGRMSLRQRMSFWAGFLYYISTALMAVLAPIPLLVMLYAFPSQVSAINLLPLTGVLVLWLAVFPVVSKARWRIEVLRVQAIYGFAHLFCIWDMLNGRTTEWVPTGVGGRKRPRIATRVKAFMVPYLVLSQGAIAVGLVAGTWTYGLGAFWATILFAAVGLYVYVPVAAVAVWPGLDRRRSRRAVVPAQRSAWEALVQGAPGTRREPVPVMARSLGERHARAR